MKKVALTFVQALVTIALIVNFSKCKNEAKSSVANTEIVAENNSKIEKENTRKPVVFIAGVDKGDNQFYANARDYFIEKEFEIVDNAYSFQEIISWLNANADGDNYGEIHIVAHANPWKGIAVETTINGERATSSTLETAIKENKIAQFNKGVSAKTKVIFHSCGLGKNENLMKTLSSVFSSEKEVAVIASPYYNVFDGNFSDHYLAKPYYVFYPTAKSPGKTDLSKEIARNYPSEKEIDWFDALNNEEERYIGEAYTYQYNIPVDFEIDFSTSDDQVPTLKNKSEIIDFISNTENLLSEMNAMEIPLNKYRWNSKIKGNKLIIKAKTTVLCVLKPLIAPYGDLDHITPKIDNQRLYATY